MGNLQELKLVIGLFLQQVIVIICAELSILRESFFGFGSVKFSRNYTTVAVTHKTTLS